MKKKFDIGVLFLVEFLSNFEYYLCQKEYSYIYDTALISIVLGHCGPSPPNISMNYISPSCRRYIFFVVFLSKDNIIHENEYK